MKINDKIMTVWT